MTAKERLAELIPALSEEQAVRFLQEIEEDLEDRAAVKAGLEEAKQEGTNSWETLKMKEFEARPLKLKIRHLLEDARFEGGPMLRSHRNGFIRREGFTLIELLVVIAIIAILAAILFPVFAKAKEKARQTNCASNLKQQGIALFSYVEDFDGVLPNSPDIGAAAPSPPDKPNPAQYWYKILSYAKSKRIFSCPSDYGYPANNLDNYWEYYGTSYQWRGSANGKPNLNELAIDEVKDASGTASLRDGLPWHQAKSGNVSSSFWGRPDNGANCLFLDGHVKFTFGTAYACGIP